MEDEERRFWKLRGFFGEKRKCLVKMAKDFTAGDGRVLGFLLCRRRFESYDLVGVAKDVREVAGIGGEVSGMSERDPYDCRITKRK
ncbi:hypothetical protein MRB53_000708 [Persea americana]|uniref:Uncharacterized protein n=1 Tax=Persea americana TaxID=3435 RepID=A0ACC2MPV5_PERAE|nr:hypothetical protein MRB53_000708 [Persea americana]